MKVISESRYNYRLQKMVNYHIQQLGLFLLQVPQEHESIPVGEILSCVTDIYNHSHVNKPTNVSYNHVKQMQYISVTTNTISQLYDCWLLGSCMISDQNIWYVHFQLSLNLCGSFCIHVDKISFISLMFYKPEFRLQSRNEIPIMRLEAQEFTNINVHSKQEF